MSRHPQVREMSELHFEGAADGRQVEGGDFCCDAAPDDARVVHLDHEERSGSENCVQLCRGSTNDSSGQRRSQ